MKPFFLIAYFFMLLSCNSNLTKDTGVINWNDSLNVVKVVQNASFCDELGIAKSNLDAIVSADNFSSILLQSISDQAKEYLYVPVSKGGALTLTIKEQKKELNEQLDSLVSKFCK